jgi:predicted transcriptional regulator
MLRRLSVPRTIKAAPLPTAAELRLLKILWTLGEATVEQVVNAHDAALRPNYKTTQTLLRIMENKGFITHQTQGRVFLFRAIISRRQVDQSAVRTLIDQNFGGSAAGLLVNLLEVTPIGKSDLNELESLIREYRIREDSRPNSAAPHGENV